MKSCRRQAAHLQLTSKVTNSSSLINVSTLALCKKAFILLVNPHLWCEKWNVTPATLGCGFFQFVIVESVVRQIKWVSNASNAIVYTQTQSNTDDMDYSDKSNAIISEVQAHWSHRRIVCLVSKLHKTSPLNLSESTNLFVAFCLQQEPVVVQVKSKQQLGQLANLV